MVTTTDSSSNHHSPTAAGDTNSPKFPRKNLPSPWAQVVRGGEPESLSGINQSSSSPPSSSSSSLSSSSLSTSVYDQPSSSDSFTKAAPASTPADSSNTAAADSSDSNNGNAGRSKKPAWNKPSNGAVEGSPVMGAVSWPALSESTKASSKLSVDSSSKTSTDGSLSSSQAPVSSPVSSHSTQKQAVNNARPNSATNYTTYNRQRSMKRGGGNSIGAGPAQRSFSSPPPPPPPPPFPVFQIPPSSYGNVVPGVSDPSSRELPYKNNNWDARPPVRGFVPAVNDHRSSSRRGTFGPHPRADGPYQNNYGGRRDQDRGSYSNTRDAHVNQQRMLPRGLVRHLPPNTAAFVAPQPLGPFANPMGFPEFYYYPTLPLEPFRGMPFFTHGPPPAMFFPVAEPPLANTIVNQIDYYFSDANLVKDEFLRSNMDGQGWVSISLIASFPRVKSLTSNIQLILDSLRTSTVVEVQGDKVRRRNEWMAWLPSSQPRVDSGGTNYNNLVADFQKIALDESATVEANPDPTCDVYPGRSTTKSSNQPQLPNGEATGNAN